MAAVHQRRGWWMRLDFSGAFGEVSGRKTPKASRVVRSELTQEAGVSGSRGQRFAAADYRAALVVE
jgi:hypothetical protein